MEEKPLNMTHATDGDMVCVWREGAPAVAGKYVVRCIVGGMAYLTTRSYNPENPPSRQWSGMLHGERVAAWLDGLRW
jgi:hypothetical protein